MLLRPLVIQCIIAFPVATASAQGVTGASIAGEVVNSEGAPVTAARLLLVNSTNGARVQAATRSRGEFLFDNIPVGGPYRLEARSIGYEPASIDNIILHLGDRVTRLIVLGRQQARVLDEVLVRGSALRDPGGGGPAYNISGDAIRNLPLLNRDFTGLLAMAPQATGASSLSISGQHVRFNAIQVDGASANDFFGLQLTPGANTGARIISLEALEEIRVLVAPFDVRQAGFSGGLINAVTRSGTNTLHGSAFSSFARSDLVGRDTAGARVGDFDIAQYGVTVGGPIIRDQLHFFFVADLQSSNKTFVGPVAGDPSTGISADSARRAQQIFRDKYRFDSGNESIPSLATPNSNVFAKLSWQLSPNHRLDVAQTWVNATNHMLQRSVTDRDGWQLSNSGSVTTSQSLITRAQARSSFGSVTNELIASITTAKLRSRSTNRVPVFLVQGDLLPTVMLAGGGVRAAQDLDTDQRAIELSDNISLIRGQHQITVGTQNQLLHFHDNFFLNHWGAWSFTGLSSLDKGEAFRYEVALPLTPGGPLADYPMTILGGYIQDRWSATPQITITTGLRIEDPFFRAPKRNDFLASRTALGGIDTGDFPNGNAEVSPRLGFALSLGRKHDSMLRGGVGAFTGKPLFAWLTGAYVNTGQEQTVLTCTVTATQGVPTPTTDIAHLPTACLGAQPARPLPTINYVTPNFRFQQAIKYVAGFDHDFGSGLTASVDAIHTRTRNTLYVSDVNLAENGLNAEGRMMYGASTTTSIRAARLDSSFAQVFRFENRSGDVSTAITTSVQKRWSSGAELDFGYNWSRTEDIMSLSGLITSAISTSNPIDGTMANRVLRRSARDIPNNFVLTAIIPAQFGITSSFFLRARSGTPYAYTIDGDANADGINFNDLVYIPRDSTDITLTNPSSYAALNAFIESQPCLSAQRGHVMLRNSCRNPSVTTLDARIAKSFLVGGRGLEVNADLFNLANMLRNGWGHVRESSNAEAKRGLITMAGWDPAARRARYAVPSLQPNVNTVVVDASRWRAQIGGRVTF